jgi:hypothetical protein
MAYSLIAHVEAKNDASHVDSSAIDTSGADLLVFVLADYRAVAVGTVSDSKSNTWTQALTYNDGSASRVTLYYSRPTTVGSGHIFSYTTSPTLSYPSICIAAFSGSVASPLDQSAGNTTAGATSLAPGSVTPTETNELIVAALSWGDAINTVAMTGYTVYQQNYDTLVGSLGSGLGWKVQTSISAENPTWTWGSSAHASAGIATFKAAGGGGGGSTVPVFMNQYRQRRA